MEQLQVKQKSKFTPGPWVVEITAATLWVGTPKSNPPKMDEIVTHIDQDGDYKDEVKEKNLANAKLIAAAPEMLELLQYISRATSSPELGRKCDAMIKKATQ